MTTRRPSLLRRLYPAVALTGVGLGLVNVLDRPAPVGSVGAPGAAGEVDPATVTTVIAGDQAASAPAPTTADSVAAQGQAAPSAPAQAPAATVAPQAPAATAAPAPAPSPAPAAGDCGAVTRTGSAAAITLRRNYGTLVVTASFTSSGLLCRSSATYSVHESKSNRYNDYAIPILSQQAVSAGSANIQGVSGATATSNAYQQSLQSAIDQL